MSATTLTPAKCGACKSDATVVCKGCNNMTYCSDACQEKDKSVHEILCGTFKDFQARPADNYFRGIYFPVNGAKPHFIWIEFEGNRTCMRMSLDEEKKHLGESSVLSVYFDEDVHFRRKYNHQVEVHYRTNFLCDGSIPNLSLKPLIGDDNDTVWRGPLLAQGDKYSFFEDDLDKVDPEDRDRGSDEEILEPPLMPLDLDTTSLNPIIFHLKWIAKRQLLPLQKKFIYDLMVGAGEGVDADVDRVAE